MILVLNAGSSSIKYTLFRQTDLAVQARGLVEKIGEERGGYVHHWWQQDSFQSERGTRFVPDHLGAFKLMVESLTEHVIDDVSDIAAVGHRVVHGGEEFSETVQVNREVKETIRKLSSLAPLHNPANLVGINVSEEVFPDAVQVAVFDTAFHQTIPPYAFRYAIPDELYQQAGIRKYGFHGTSHRFVTETCQRHFNKNEVNLIIAHLGNGCSMTAVSGGKSVDNSMGLTPLPGLIMGTRSGDVDPSVIFHLVKHEGMDLDSVEKILNKESGLLGICGHLDLREIIALHDNGDEKATLALAMYCYRIRQYIGQYMVSVPELDALVFTAGVGENSPLIRKRVLEGMERFGLMLDPDRNNAEFSATVNDISTSASSARILVIPTDEEKQIAHEVKSLIP